MPRPHLTVETVQELVGETVYDPYGRVLGQLVSFESDVDGTVLKLVVENERKEIEFLDSGAVVLEDGRIVALPEWKRLANNVIASYKRALARMKGLEEMYSRGEIPGNIYHEFSRKLSASLEKLKKESKQLKAMITQRMHEIEDANLRLDKAIASLKISYIANEISDKAYKVAVERLRSAKDSNMRELEDLKTTKARIEALESGSIRIGSEKHPAKHVEKKEERHEAPAAPAKPAPQAPSMEGLQPIPVKLIEG